MDHYLTSVDYYSKWVSVERLDSDTCSAVASVLDVRLAHFGILEKMFSANGPQFACAEFEEFANRFHFKHITSSPNYPRSNGLVIDNRRIFSS